MIVGKAVGGEFRFVPSSAEPEDEPAIADFISCLGNFGEQRRVAEAHAGDQRADFDPRRGRPNGSQHLPAFPASLGGRIVQLEDHVIRDPDRIETIVFSFLRQPKDIAPTMNAGTHFSVAIGKIESDFDVCWCDRGHAASSWTRRFSTVSSWRSNRTGLVLRSSRQMFDTV